VAEFRFGMISHIDLYLIPKTFVVSDFFAMHANGHNTPQCFDLIGGLT
jgi:hypothetical protein